MPQLIVLGRGKYFDPAWHALCELPVGKQPRHATLGSKDVSCWRVRQSLLLQEGSHGPGGDGCATTAGCSTVTGRSTTAGRSTAAGHVACVGCAKAAPGRRAQRRRFPNTNGHTPSSMEPWSQVLHTPPQKSPSLTGGGSARTVTMRAAKSSIGDRGSMSVSFFPFFFACLCVGTSETERRRPAPT